MFKPPIFVIDDEPVVQRVLVMLLQEMNYQVTPFASAESFFARASSLDFPHLLLVDRMLPGMSGVDLVGQHRAAGNTFEAILISAFWSAEDTPQGFYTSLQKPFEFVSLLNSISGATSKLKATLKANQRNIPLGHAGEADVPDLVLEEGLITCVGTTISEKWSGMITIRGDGELLGVIAMCDGMIAWATCKHQTENLGTFLWRLGCLTHAQLQEVRRLYDQHSGKKRLGQILEEEGLITRPVLRHCLRLHIKHALTSLLSIPNADTERSDSERITAHDDLCFSPGEVLPVPILTALARRRQDRPQNSISQPTGDLVDHISTTPGYLASTVVSKDGSVLTAHFDPIAHKPPVFGAFLAAVLDAATNLSAGMYIGLVNSVILDCTEGQLATRWVDEARHYFSAVLADSNADSQLLKTNLDKYTHAIKGWLSKLPPGSGAHADRTKVQQGPLS